MANKDLTSQEMLEMMDKFMSGLDDRLGDIDARLEDLEKLLSEFEKIAQERSPGKNKETTKISVDISLRTADLNGINEAKFNVIQNKIKAFMRQIMTHPDINGIEVEAKQRGVEKWS